MKKILLLFLISMFTIGMCRAQSSTKVKYQGEVVTGYSLGIGAFNIDRINIHTIHGIRVNQFFSIGVGLGLDYYYHYDWYVNSDYEASELSMPIFLNTKGYLPVSEKTDLFLSLDFGASVGLTDGVSGMKGLLITPSVGSAFKVSDRNSITLSLGYNYQRWSNMGIGINADALSFKVGFQF